MFCALSRSNRLLGDWSSYRDASTAVFAVWRRGGRKLDRKLTYVGIGAHTTHEFRCPERHDSTSPESPMTGVVPTDVSLARAEPLTSERYLL
jgi:hypothetical protein